jgi:hypothetical protein
MAHVIQLRGGTAAEASAANPILRERELAVETDTGLFKVGDGVNTWNNLPYSSGVLAIAATAFPANPAFGTECYRTDLSEWYKYNGSTWTQI